ncbi:transposase [Streptococcus pyogenes]|nr:transposase [Streptococcus pyogenes]
MALDVVTKTDKTPLLGRILSKYVGRLTSCIENETTKIRNHSRQNDTIGLTHLLGNLKTVHNPEIILKTINVYSRRLQVFSQIMATLILGLIL